MDNGARHLNMLSKGIKGDTMSKKLICGMLVLGLAAILAPGAMAYTGTYVPGTGINNTVHDLATAKNGMNYTPVPADPLNRICIYCHAPHNTWRLSTATGGLGPRAPAAFDYLPLWNHDLTGFTTNFTMYENGPGAPLTGPKALQAAGQMVPGSNSLLCLSCHDGTIAVNSYGNSDQLSASVSSGTTFIVSQYQIGKDKYLGNHHPIGFNYDDVQSIDTEIRSADTAQLTPTDFVRDHLSNNQMECATCHSVHNKGNAGEHLLWRSDQNSELCLTCHDKGIYTAP
jgi:predicted CXXCH cytochrome family protein